MNNNINKHASENNFDPRFTPLAQWLLRLLADSDSATPPYTTLENSEELLTNYHPRFFQQLPDFIMALLNNDPNATLHYAPLLYHLVGCPSCHQAYLELYDALSAAVEPGADYAPLDVPTTTLDTTPPTMLKLLCQLLISQAEAVKRQARHEHTDGDALARSLLQQALQVSKHLTMSNMRHQALQDLVRVATLYEETAEQGPALSSLSLATTGNGGLRHGGSTMRRIGTPSHPAEQPTIYLHARTLEGSVTQEGDTLVLHLHNLDKSLRGQYLSIKLPLGPLFEPVRWRGGNPHTIRSAAPVDEHGILNTPLGETELRLDNPEDHNLLEAMFLLLEVRTIH
jgi:hypothetical protein